MTRSIKFGQMLSEAIHIIKVCENKTVQAVQDELGYALGRNAGSAIVRWRAGPLPPTIDDREKLAQLIIQRSHGRLGREWLKTFLVNAKHPYPEKICNELFPTTTSGTVVPFPYSSLHQLRAPVGDFVGRTKEISYLVEALGTDKVNQGVMAGICGIRGMGGIGKTELAYAVAQQISTVFHDAQIVINLSGTADTPLSSVQVLQDVIRAFKPDIPLPDDPIQLRGIYRSLLYAKRVLVLADDAYDAAQVSLLQPPPGCVLLVTSRHRFKLPGMHLIDLETLPSGDAERLLLQICPRISNLAPRLAKLCGGLPLALRVSATLLANDVSSSVDDYVRELVSERERLSLLRDPDDPLLDVKAALVLSYEMLEETARSVLCQLSVFAGSFDVSAAEAVVELPTQLISGGIEQVLGLLYRRSLLNYDQGRYHLHSLVRILVRTRLGEAANTVQMRHAHHYAKVFAHAEELYKVGGKHILTGLALFDAERLQINAGWNWVSQQVKATDTVGDLLLAYANVAVYVADLRYNMEQERIPQLESALEVAQRLRRKNAEGDTLNNLGLAYKNLGDVHRAIAYYEQALTMYQEFANHQGESVVWGNLGTAYRYLEEYHRAISCYEKQYKIAQMLDASPARSFDTSRGRAYALGGLGAACSHLGDTARAIRYYEQQLILNREIGNRRGEAFALGGLGCVYVRLSMIERAVSYYNQQLRLTVEMGDRHSQGHAQGSLGVAYYESGDLQRAIEYYQQQLTVTSEFGDRRGQATACWNLGLALLRKSEHEAAIALMQKCVDFEYSANILSAKKHNESLERLRDCLCASERDTKVFQYLPDPIIPHIG